MVLSKCLGVDLFPESERSTNAAEKGGADEGGEEGESKNEGDSEGGDEGTLVVLDDAEAGRCGDIALGAVVSERTRTLPTEV